MKWFRRRKRKLIFNSISVPGLIRRSIYDSMMTKPEAIAVAMGLPPISSEVSEMEERASDERINNISVLLPFIDSHSDVAANIVTSAYALESDDFEEITAEEIDDMTKLFRLVALSATVSGISLLVDLGLIEVKVTNDN